MIHCEKKSSVYCPQKFHELCFFSGMIQLSHEDFRSQRHCFLSIPSDLKSIVIPPTKDIMSLIRFYRIADNYFSARLQDLNVTKLEMRLSVVVLYWSRSKSSNFGRMLFWSKQMKMDIEKDIWLIHGEQGIKSLK